jgi:hypothetical protein
MGKEIRQEGEEEIFQMGCLDNPAHPLPSPAFVQYSYCRCFSSNEILKPSILHSVLIGVNSLSERKIAWAPGGRQDPGIIA